jgi:SM-20-related protein
MTQRLRQTRPQPHALVKPRGKDFFKIASSIDGEEMSATFRSNRRLHIKEFLGKTAAEALYRHLDGHVDWSTFLTANGRMYEAPASVRRKYESEQEQALIDLAHRSARKRGMGYAYDASQRRTATSRSRDPSLLDRFAAFVNSGEFTDVIRRISGIDKIASIAIQAVRLRPGHFMTFHDALLSGDKQGSCRAAFSYNLTPEWKAEWGGLLEFRSGEGHLVEAYAPCFNCLDVFAIPQGRWLSVVSPFAGGPSYSVTGSVYVEGAPRTPRPSRPGRATR